MIGFLEGATKAVRGNFAIVVAGGVGYKVFASKDTLAGLSADRPAEMWIYNAVREDAFDLYGFPAEEELRFFELLLTVSGIGPRSALTILDVASVETLQSAISSSNANYLTSVSGIGKKTAEKIVVELRDKVAKGKEGTGAALQGDAEALEAMRSLGYTAQEARDALRNVPAIFTKSNERLREALRLLGK